jgi:hypothetical protein
VAEQDGSSLTGGTDSGSFDGSQYVDGFSVSWVRVSLALAGSLALGWTYGVLEVLTSAGGEVQGLIDGVRESIESLIGTVFDTPATVVEESWTTAAEFVTGYGVTGYVMGILIVMVTLWAFSEGVSRVGS